MELRPFSFKPAAVKELLRSKSTFAFVIMTILLSKYDTQIFEEETEVIAEQIKDDFQVDIPEEVENRLNAAINVLTTDLVFINFNVFKSVALAFAEGNIGNVENREDEELNVCEILWTLNEIALLKGITVQEVKESLRPYVIDELNKIIDDEAEDLDEVDEPEEEGVEAITEVSRDPYYWRYTVESLTELLDQLRKLGVGEGLLQQIKTTFLG